MSRGYIAATTGATTGGMLVGVILAIIAYITDFSRLEGPCLADGDCVWSNSSMISFTLVFQIGYLLGAGAGCWLLLRLRSHADAALTSALAIGLMFLSALLFQQMSAIVEAVRVITSGSNNTFVHDVVAFMAMIMIFLCPIVARRLTFS